MVFGLISPAVCGIILSISLGGAATCPTLKNLAYLISTEKTMKKIKKIEIQDKVFEETYTAHIQSNGTNWLGWIPEVPKVKCEAPTEVVLLKTLEKRLHEALVAEEEAWEKQFKADVKAGKLDKFRKEALEDVRAGRVKYL